MNTAHSQGAELHGIEFEILMETTDMRASIFKLRPGQVIPWHFHTAIADQFHCLEGAMLVELRDPSAVVRLLPGERCSAEAGRPHKVREDSKTGCRFLLIQGVGAYDNFVVPD